MDLRHIFPHLCSGALLLVAGSPLHASNIAPLVAAPAVFEGEEDALRLAQSVVVGDFNGDRHDDLALGITGKARVQILLGDGSAGFLAREGNQISGVVGTSFGASLAAVDLNSDGADELLVGAPDTGVGDEPAAGVVYVFSLDFGTSGLEATARQIAGPTRNQRMGASVAALEVGGSTLLLLGAPGKTSPGRLYCLDVKSLPTGTLPLDLSGSDACLVTTTNGDHFGQTLHVADLDGDGQDDVLVGAPESQSGRGIVWLLRGEDVEGAQQDPELISSGAVVGEAPDSNAGASLSAWVGTASSTVSGSLLLIGSPGDDGGRGRVQVFDAINLLLGNDALTFTATGSTEGEGLGSSISWVGELLPGALPGLLAGAPGGSFGGATSGGGGLFFPYDQDAFLVVTSQDAAIAVYGESPGDQAGALVAALPRSGEAGALVFGPGIDRGQTDEGAAGWFTASVFLDGDGDGHLAVSGDCDDADAAIYPGAGEPCDGIDNNCNGVIDDPSGVTWYYDSDGDGYGGSEAGASCEQPPGTVGTGGDCNDADTTTYPGASEVCDGADHNCDGQTDGQTDYDGDGSIAIACMGLGPDCDDYDGQTYPGAPELCDGKDNDCDGAIDYAFDGDGDGYPGSTCGSSPDCDDTNPGVNPGQGEVCDGVDNNCDGRIDELTDQDSDGYAVSDCNGGPSDCDDNDSAVNPGAYDGCDGRDNNCDGRIDDAVDADGDGAYTDPSCGGEFDCDDARPEVRPGNGEVCDGLDNNCDGGIDEGYDQDGDGALDAQQCGEGGADCDDLNPDVHPGAAERCDGADNDCDGAADEDFDQDGDGHLSELTCAGGEGADDCDDADPHVYGGAPELCDQQDNNCNGEIDEGTEIDGDGDGQTACEGDCDDTDRFINTSAQEYCDGEDNNCDGHIDEGFDLDQDGWLDPTQCLSLPNRDCDDTDNTVYPGAPELCDGQDNDCDVLIDEGLDADGDGWNAASSCGGYGDCDDADPEISPDAAEICDRIDNNCDGQVDNLTEGGCEQQPIDQDGDGFVVEQDCDDSNPEISPDAEEVCDEADNNCDGSVDEGFDLDEDGHLDGELCPTGLGTDCDDADPDTHPGASEVCDGLDNDCSGNLDSGEATDRDGDGYPACDDCADRDPNIHPEADEICDGQDNDCDNRADEDFDRDGDGHLDPAACGNLGKDCDESNPDVNPDAQEQLGNDVDENCDGRPADVDADGYCANPGDAGDCPGQADCDDTDEESFPGAEEIPDDGVDQDCDGEDDTSTTAPPPTEEPTDAETPEPTLSPSPTQAPEPPPGVGCGAASETDGVAFTCAQGRAPSSARGFFELALPILIGLRLRRSTPKARSKVHRRLKQPQLCNRRSSRDRKC